MNENDVREPWWFRHPVMATILGIAIIALVCVGGYAVKVALSPS